LWIIMYMYFIERIGELMLFVEMKQTAPAEREPPPGKKRRCPFWGMPGRWPSENARECVDSIWFFVEALTICLAGFKVNHFAEAVESPPC
jgi:hypothetical protein